METVQDREAEYRWVLNAFTVQLNNREKRGCVGPQGPDRLKADWLVFDI